MKHLQHSDGGGPAKAKTPTGTDQLWLLPAEGLAHRRPVVEVAVRARTWKTLVYGVPEALQADLAPGALVRVPYGRGGRLVDAVCIRVGVEDWRQTHKPIAAVLSASWVLSAALTELALWVVAYYGCTPWQALTCAVPASARNVRPRRVIRLRATGADAEGPVTEKQQRVLEALAEGELQPSAIRKRVGVGAGVVRKLCERGLVERVLREVDLVEDHAAADRSFSEPVAAVVPEDEFALTDGQRAACDTITARIHGEDRFRVMLLFGLPGSGKTEVYVRSIRAAIAAGRQAILVVPEIALATQIVERLARRFQRVVILHSRLPERRRAAAFAAIAGGRVDVVIGTRTAVFAPCPRLGLIVVDEEQESSLKNLAAPYYHARDVAIKRGQIENAPVVLGSATPSLESWHNAATLKHFELLRLPERVPGARLPAVRLVRQASRELGQTTHVLSPPLIAELRRTFAAGEQAILLHNRRGYATLLRCRACGLAVHCPRCGANMVLHRGENRCKCHRCGAAMPAPATCTDSSCGGALERSGLAIQRLEEELLRTFAGVRLLRVDSDTMRRSEDYRAMLRAFESHEADVLLGTQMVAKGLDFPAVRLVGVVAADAGLWLPDFRSGESTFQLLVQVVGRAGRRSGDSLALVQTGEVVAPAIEHAVRMDYEGFAVEELAARKAYFLPPFARMIRMVCADPQRTRSREAAQALHDGLRQLAERISADIRVDPAEACVIRAARGRTRHQVVVRAPRGGAAQALLQAAIAERLLTPRVERFVVDVDPLEML